MKCVVLTWPSMIEAVTCGAQLNGALRFVFGRAECSGVGLVFGTEMEENTRHQGVLTLSRSRL